MHTFRKNRLRSGAAVCFRERTRRKRSEGGACYPPLPELRFVVLDELFLSCLETKVHVTTMGVALCEGYADVAGTDSLDHATVESVDVGCSDDSILICFNH